MFHLPLRSEDSASDHYDEGSYNYPDNDVEPLEVITIDIRAFPPSIKITIKNVEWSSFQGGNIYIDLGNSKQRPSNRTSRKKSKVIDNANYVVKKGTILDRIPKHIFGTKSSSRSIMDFIPKDLHERYVDTEKKKQPYEPPLSLRVKNYMRGIWSGSATGNRASEPRIKRSADGHPRPTSIPRSPKSPRSIINIGGAALPLLQRFGFSAPGNKLVAGVVQGEKIFSRQGGLPLGATAVVVGRFSLGGWFLYRRLKGKKETKKKIKLETE